MTAGAAGGAKDAEAARGSEPGGGARRGRAPRSRERARERIRVLMLMLLPGTGRTAHALLWGGGRGQGGLEKQQSDAATQAASEGMVAPPEVGEGEAVSRVLDRKEERVRGLPGPRQG